MSFRIDGNFNWNLQGIEQAFNTISKAVQPIASAVTQVVTAAKTATAKPISSNYRLGDIGASLLRSQLQAGAVKNSAPVAAAAAVKAAPKAAAFEPFNPNAALGFFSKLAGGFVSSLVNKVASKVPSGIIETGMNIASSIFGGNGPQQIDAETRSRLESFGLDPRAVSAARIFNNSTRSIKGYATTIGKDIHFGDAPNPKYWVEAAKVQQLIDAGASAEDIAAAQNSLRESIKDFSLLSHEVNHVAQFIKEGSVGFAARYASDFAGGFVNTLLDQAFSGKLDAKNIFNLNDRNSPLGKAYRDVSFEQESYGLDEVIENKLLAQYGLI